MKRLILLLLVFICFINIAYASNSTNGTTTTTQITTTTTATTTTSSSTTSSSTSSTSTSSTTSTTNDFRFGYEGGINWETSKSGEKYSTIIYPRQQYFPTGHGLTYINESFTDCGEFQCSKHYYYNATAYDYTFVNLKYNGKYVNLQNKGFLGHISNGKPNVTGSKVTYTILEDYITLDYQYIFDKFKHTITINKTFLTDEQWINLGKFKVPYDYVTDGGIDLKQSVLCDQYFINCTNLTYEIKNNKIDIEVPGEFIAASDTEILYLDPDFLFNFTNISWMGYTFKRTLRPPTYGINGNPASTTVGIFHGAMQLDYIILRTGIEYNLSFIQDMTQWNILDITQKLTFTVAPTSDTKLYFRKTPQGSKYYTGWPAFFWLEMGNNTVYWDNNSAFSQTYYFNITNMTDDLKWHQDTRNWWGYGIHTDEPVPGPPAETPAYFATHTYATEPERPWLNITYFLDECIPPDSGLWEINKSCYFYNITHPVPGDIKMHSNATFYMSNVTFNISIPFMLNMSIPNIDIDVPVDDNPIRFNISKNSFDKLKINLTDDLN